MTGAVVPNVKQRTAEWHALRDVSIGSSDIPVIVGLSPWKSAYELALEKRGELHDEEREPDDVDQRDVGELMEPVLLELYRRRTGRNARRVRRVIALPDRPWAIASLDAETLGERPNRDIELKHSSSVRWSAKTLPEDVEVQVMWQMGVSGYRAADVCALVPGGFRIVPVDFDESYFDDLVVIAERFLERIGRAELPTPDGSESTRRALARRWQADDGTFLSTSVETDAIAAEIREAKRALVEAKGRLGTAENAARALIGEATGFGALEADGYRVTWKRTAERTEVDWKGYATALEELLDEVRQRHLDTADDAALGARIEDERDEHTTTRPGSRRLLVRFRDAEPGGGDDE